MTTSIFLLLLSGIFLNASAQLLLKKTMLVTGTFAFQWNAMGAACAQLATSPFLWVGLGCYVVSVALWILVLSRVEVSFAYPMVSLGYVLNAAVAYYWLGEAVTPLRWMGIACILVGVALIARS